MASSVIQGTFGDASEIPSVWNQPPLSRAERRAELNQSLRDAIKVADIKRKQKGKEQQHLAFLGKYISRQRELSLVLSARLLATSASGDKVPLYGTFDDLFEAFNEFLKNSSEFPQYQVTPYYGRLGRRAVPRIRLVHWHQIVNP